MAKGKISDGYNLNISIKCLKCSDILLHEYHGPSECPNSSIYMLRIWINFTNVGHLSFLISSFLQYVTTILYHGHWAKI